jgi:hypothetical protein
MREFSGYNEDDKTANLQGMWQWLVMTKVSFLMECL